MELLEVKALKEPELLTPSEIDRRYGEYMIEPGNFHSASVSELNEMKSVIERKIEHFEKN